MSSVALDAAGDGDKDADRAGQGMDKDAAGRQAARGMRGQLMEALKCTTN